MAFQASGTSKHFNDINITPLTDIFLVLLVIMMVVAPLLNYKGLKLEIPQASESAPPSNARPFTLTLTAEGQLLASDKQQRQTPLTLADLKPTLEAAHTTDPTSAGVRLQVAKAAPYKQLTQVIDGIQASRVSKLSIQALEDAS
jgi:biopolymer transport protein ExbD/biopolymer transport protein TolR